MARPQFTLKTMLWVMLVAALVAHSFWQRERHRREVRELHQELRDWKIKQQVAEAELANVTGRTAGP